QDEPILHREEITNRCANRATLRARSASKAGFLLALRAGIAGKETRIMTALPRSLALIAVLGATALGAAADWAQYLGPNRNGTSPETGLLTGWTGEGPKVLWKADGGEGYSSIAVSGGKCFTLIQRGGEELVLALDAGTGKEAWKHRIGPAYKNQYGNGP